MGLLARLFSSERDVNIGAVDITIILKEGVDYATVEQKLKNLDIIPYNHIDSIGTCFCKASKEVYEKVFDTQLRVIPSKYQAGNQYIQKNKPSIPASLSELIEMVGLNNGGAKASRS